MKNLTVLMFASILLMNCAIDSSSLNLGTSFSQYAAACKKATMGDPQLVAAEGSFRAYRCHDGSQYEARRYEVFEDDVLVKVFSKRISAAEKQANLNQMLLGLSLLQGGTTPTTSLGSTDNTMKPIGFLTKEYISGMYRLCYYNTVGGTQVKSVGAAEICPIQW